VIASGRYIETFDIADKLVTDEDGRIYLPFLYRDFRLNLSGTILQSTHSPANALACFDKDGSLVWARNALPPWRDYFAKTQALTYDQECQQLTTIQSQGSYHVMNRCRVGKVKYFLQHFDRTGALIDTLSWQGSKMGGMADATCTLHGRLIGVGFYRDTLDLGRFSMTSLPREDECGSNSSQGFEGFSLGYDMASGHIPFAQRMPSFLPLQVEVHGDFLYYPQRPSN